eukprot:gene6251-7784_t
MQYVNGLDVAQNILDEVNFINKSELLKWDLLSDGESKVYSAENPSNNGLLFKCTGEIDYPADFIWNVLYRAELQEEWDEFCLKCKCIEELDSLNYIYYYAFASPLAGSLRYFCLFRSCHMDLKNKRYSLVFRSIENETAEQEISDLDGNPHFSDLGSSGWIFEEIEPNRTRVVFITQLSETMQLVTLPEDKREYYRDIYKKTAIHTIYKIPNLFAYIKNMKPNLRSSLEIFKQTSDAIASFESYSWNLFRKQNDMEFYYKNTAEENYLDYLVSGSFSIDSTSEIIQSFILSNNTYLIDPWTYSVEVNEEIDKNTTIIKMKYRSIFSVNQEIVDLLVKQTNSLPMGIKFIGFKSPQTSKKNIGDFFFFPCGYYIMPLTQGCLVRFLFQFRVKIPPEIFKPLTTRKKACLSLSERVLFMVSSLKNQILQFQYDENKRDALMHPHWKSLEDKSITEIVELFYNMAIQDIHSTRIEYNVDSNNNDNNNTNTNGEVINLKKRKSESQPEYHERTSIMSIHPQFCFSKNGPYCTTTLPPIPFTPNWEKFIKRRPFLLLVSKQKTFPPRKTPKCVNCLNTDSLFDLLPEEIIHYILSFLDASDLLYISMTCKVFLATASNDYLWKELFDHKWKSATSLIDINTNESDGEDSICGIVDWKRKFIQKEILEKNWHRGSARVSRLQGHRSKITRLQFGSDIAITAATDKALKLWNLGTKQCEYTLKQQTNCSVVSFEKDNLSKLNSEIFPYCLYDNTRVRIGYSNGLIQSFNLATKTIDYEQQFVYLAEGYIFHLGQVHIWEGSCVQIWEQETSQSVMNFNHTRTKINQCRIGIQPKTIMTACTDKTLKVWDTSSNQLAQVFLGHSAGVNCFDYYGDYNFVTGSNDKTIRVWDTRNTVTCLSILKHHRKKIRTISMTDRRLCSGGDDNSIQICGFYNNELKLTSTILNSIQTSPSCCSLSADEETIISGFSDGSICYYDFS